MTVANDNMDPTDDLHHGLEERIAVWRSEIGHQDDAIDLERRQTTYLPIYAAWAVVVVAMFPLVFGFV